MTVVAALSLAIPGVLSAAPGPDAGASSTAGGRPYIVRAATVQAASSAVTAVGGRVVASLPLVHGVDATLTARALRALSGLHGILATPDVVMHALGQDYSPEGQADQLARMDLGAQWSTSSGEGVGVALIDTGVAPTPGITASHLVRSPNFSGSQDDFDGYGHGTFMAGLIAANGQGGPAAVTGVAPGVTLVAVKVGASDGSTSVAKVIEGIGWAVTHRLQYNVRVMSISFGASIPLPPSQNPLDGAVEAAWAAGITVVVAAGNHGMGQVTSPGDDPRVITVGAETTTGPYLSPAWSSYSAAKPDVLAPGVSVESLRAPGSLIDRANPGARIGGIYFKGSGSSMATALTAGAAALLIHDHPGATPDDIKDALTSTDGPQLVGHAGPIDINRADDALGSPSWRQRHPIASSGSAGTGTSSWDTMSWDTMSWDTMSWDTMSWDTMSWDDESW